MFKRFFLNRVDARFLYWRISFFRLAQSVLESFMFRFLDSFQCVLCCSWGFKCFNVCDEFRKFLKCFSSMYDRGFGLCKNTVTSFFQKYGGVLRVSSSVDFVCHMFRFFCEFVLQVWFKSFSFFWSLFFALCFHNCFSNIVDWTFFCGDCFNFSFGLRRVGGFDLCFQVWIRFFVCVSWGFNTIFLSIGFCEFYSV